MDPKGCDMGNLDVSVCGFGDNVVDVYEHVRTMYPGGNAVNFAVYAKKAGVRRAAYMGYFGTDDRAEHVISSLYDEGIELVKCKQLMGENGYSCVSIAEDGDRIWGDYNQGGVRGESRYVLDRFDIEYLRQFDVVHSGNYCYTERQLPKIAAAGIELSFDFSDDSTWEYYQEVAPRRSACARCTSSAPSGSARRAAWTAAMPSTASGCTGRSPSPSSTCATRWARATRSSRASW